MPNDELQKQSIQSMQELTQVLRVYHDSQIVMQTQLAQLMDDRDTARKTKMGILIAGVGAVFAAIGTIATKIVDAWIANGHIHH